jgi:HK97 family phage major capsid protein
MTRTRVKETEREKKVTTSKLLLAGVDPDVVPLDSAEESRAYLDELEAAERIARLEMWNEEAENAYTGSRVARSAEHADKARDVARIRKRLMAGAEGHLHRAASQLVGREDERLPDSEFAVFRKAVDRAVDERDLGAKLGAIEGEHRRAAVALRVTEAGPYDDLSSPHSWVRDVLVQSDPEMRNFLSSRSGGSDMSVSAVAERLRRHGVDVSRAVQRRDAFGKRVRAQLSEQRRQADPDVHRRLAQEELRAFTTGGGATASASGGGAAAFVPPAVILEQFTEYRSPYRAFADQCNSSVPLPDYGLEVYVPTVTTGSTVTTQTEGSAVSEGDPVTSFAAGQVVNKAGQITVTQQYLDRAGPGIAGDQLLFAQIKSQLDSQIDVYALAQALSGAQTVTNNGAFTVTTASGVGGFLKDLKTAKNSLHDTAGVRLRGTHCFATGDFVDYISSYADAQGRPLFSPSYDGNHLPIRSQGDPAGEGFSGYVLTGLALFADDNIPTYGTISQTQVIVTRPDTILLLEGAPIPYVYPPSVAGSLEAVLGVRAYVATIAKYASGVSAISGSAYAASTFA